MTYWGIGVVNTDCPFYIRESRLEITCQGVEQDSKSTKKFDTREQKEAFQKSYCFPGCCRCHTAQALNKIFDP